MTNIPSDATFTSLTTVLRHVLREWSRFGLHTSIPGIIETFDAATRRARVRVAIRMRLDDGTTVERAPSINVPVLYPGSRTVTIFIMLVPGDPVWVKFSERGMTAFKESFELADPDPGRLFSEADAVIEAGFGPLSITPATTTGGALQTADGTVFISVEDSRVRVEAPEVIIKSPQVTIESEDVKVGGENGKALVTKDFLVNFFNVHTHTIGTPPSPTSPPVTGMATLIPGADITKRQTSE